MEFSEKPFKYIFNGKEYDSLEDVPPEFRSLLKDENNDGIPDILQKNEKNVLFSKSSDIQIETVNNITKYKVNGEEYQSLEEMPDDIRRIVENIEKQGDSFGEFSSPVFIDTESISEVPKSVEISENVIDIPWNKPDTENTVPSQTENNQSLHQQNETSKRKSDYSDLDTYYKNPDNKKNTVILILILIIMFLIMIITIGIFLFI